MAEYNYDEQGQFFPFFVVAILLLFLVPVTYRTIAKRDNGGTRIECTCDMCIKKSRHLAEQREKKLYQPAVIRKFILLAIGWGIVGYMLYRIATTKVENKIWDPYAVLGISSLSSLEKIKSHYKKLSKTLHPDKIKLVGNMTKEMVEKRFVDVTKAYKALTDDEIRRNYEEYGHPDGKQEYSVGIALPKWIVESSNGYYVLAFYGLLFGAFMPAVVGKWWYGSRSLTKEGIETETAARYFKAVKENTATEDVIDILSFSREYELHLNANKAVDDFDTVGLEKQLAQANIPLSSMQYHPGRTSKTTDLLRNLFYAHLNRIQLDPTLEAEKCEIISDSIKLQNALVQIALAFNYFQPVYAAMEVSQRLLQAIPMGGSPLLQLPGVDNTLASTLSRSEKNPIRNVQDLLHLNEQDRRKALEDLDDKTYARALSIAKQIPILLVSNVHFKVSGDSIVTPVAIVQLIFTARLATQNDYANLTIDTSSDDSDVEGDEDSTSVDPNKSRNGGAAVPIPFAHAPYFPIEHKPHWWAFLADPQGDKIIVHPIIITDVGTSSQKWRIQFQAPPTVGSYKFKFHIKSDSYCGTDYVQDVFLQVQDASKLEKAAEEVIPESGEEDSEKEESELDEDSSDFEDTDTSTSSDSDSE